MAPSPAVLYFIIFLYNSFWHEAYAVTYPNKSNKQLWDWWSNYAKLQVLTQQIHTLLLTQYCYIIWRARVQFYDFVYFHLHKQGEQNIRSTFQYNSVWYTNTTNYSCLIGLHYFVHVYLKNNKSVWSLTCSHFQCLKGSLTPCVFRW